MLALQDSYGKGITRTSTHDGEVCQCRPHTSSMAHESFSCGRQCTPASWQTLRLLSLTMYTIM